MTVLMSSSCVSLAGLIRLLSLRVAGNHQPQWNLGALKKDTRMKTMTKPLSAIWQDMMHRTHAWLCKQFGAVPEWQVDEAIDLYERQRVRLTERLEEVEYRLALTNGPVWHGPWKTRKDGTGKYRSVKVARVTYKWNSQKVSFLTNHALTAYDGDPICRGVSSWYNNIPKRPASWGPPEGEPEPLHGQLKGTDAVVAEMDDDEDIPF
jgi:hypothetical protein